jgi:hypothetical protein
MTASDGLVDIAPHSSFLALLRNGATLARAEAAHARRCRARQYEQMSCARSLRSETFLDLPLVLWEVTSDYR